MCIRVLACMGLTVLVCHVLLVEGIMPFTVIVLCIPVHMCHCSSVGNTITGLRPPLKYLVL